MSADEDGADPQDQAETFDETNLTRDGEDIAHPDMARDVADYTAAPEDSDEDEAADEDFDADDVDEAQIDLMLERDDGVDEPRSFAADDADRVASDDVTAADFESSRVSDEDLEDLGYVEDPAPG